MTLLKNDTVTIQFPIKLKISVLKNSMWMDCSKIAKEVLALPTVPNCNNEIIYNLICQMNLLQFNFVFGLKFPFLAKIFNCIVSVYQILLP